MEGSNWPTYRSNGEVWTFTNVKGVTRSLFMPCFLKLHEPPDLTAALTDCQRVRAKSHLSYNVALYGMHSSAVLILFSLFFCEATVGVGGSDKRDQLAPTQTAAQLVGLAQTENVV